MRSFPDAVEFWLSDSSVLRTKLFSLLTNICHGYIVEIHTICSPLPAIFVACPVHILPVVYVKENTAIFGMSNNQMTQMVRNTLKATIILAHIENIAI